MRDKHNVFGLSWWVLTAGLMVLNSCSPSSQFTVGRGNKYVYAYVMVTPFESRDLLFQDDSLIVQFKIDEAAVKFQLQNLSQSGMVIDYGHASLGVDGQMHPVRFSRTLYTDNTQQLTSVEIPPMAYVRDVLIPRENVSFDGNRWVESDLVPTTDNNSELLRKQIVESPGKRRIDLVVPVRFGAINRNYTFEFQVDSVAKIPWKDYAPAKRVPPPPPPKSSITDQVVTAVLVVGVLGFAAYIISVKKGPPTE